MPVSVLLAACKGSGGPTETLDQLLELDEALGKGHTQSWDSKEQPVEYLLAFRTLAEVGYVEGCKHRATVRVCVGFMPYRHRVWTVYSTRGEVGRYMDTERRGSRKAVTAAAI